MCQFEKGGRETETGTGDRERDGVLLNSICVILLCCSVMNDCACN